MFTDTHAHIFKEYYEDMDLVIKNAKEKGIERIINNGCSNTSNKEVLEIAKKYKNVYAAIGIHPEEVDNYKEEDIDFIIKHIKDEKVIALGEIGLDYYYMKENKEKQKELFRKQLEIAEKFSLPVIIHSREATNDTINILKEYKVTGVIHSFTGSLETAKIYLKMGFLLGINGVITFKNANLKEVIKEIPVTSLVLETDSPYLSPEPKRGRKNEPANISLIADFLKDLKDISLLELSNITNQNIKRIFDI